MSKLDLTKCEQGQLFYARLQTGYDYDSAYLVGIIVGVPISIPNSSSNSSIRVNLLVSLCIKKAHGALKLKYLLRYL